MWGAKSIVLRLCSPAAPLMLSFYQISSKTHFIQTAESAGYFTTFAGGRKFSITQSCGGSGLSVSVENVMRDPSG